MLGAFIFDLNGKMERASGGKKGFTTNHFKLHIAVEIPKN